MALKLQIASDLHLEFLWRHWPGIRLIEPAEGAQALILAGDIASGTSAIQAFADWPVPVFYVPGNHEFYGRDITKLHQEMRAAAAGTQVRVLDCEEVIFEGTRILGATLWTDYRLRSGRTQSSQMELAGQFLSDHACIEDQGFLFSPAMALARHESSRRWLKDKKAQPFDGKTVVITHHAPHPRSVAPKFVGNELNGAFVSDLSDDLYGVALWVHGHTHNNFDYRVNGCRVVANTRGYPMNVKAALMGLPLMFENTSFDPSFVVTV